MLEKITKLYLKYDLKNIKKGNKNMNKEKKNKMYICICIFIIIVFLFPTFKVKAVKTEKNIYIQIKMMAKMDQLLPQFPFKQKFIIEIHYRMERLAAVFQ